MSEKKSKKGLTAFLIILGVIILLISITSVITVFSKASFFSFDKIVNNISNNSVQSTKTAKQPKGQYVAVIYIEGTIQKAGSTYNQDWLLDTIAKLKNDNKNKGILLFIDSPGGTVYESDEAYLALQSYKTTGKKVYAYMGSLAASGGYYISCAAEKICANRNTLTGSIGVIAGQSIDLTEFLEFHGIKYTTITAGKNKNMGNYNEPLSDEQRQIMQDIADDCYGQFTSIVASSRHIPYKEVLPLCDGRVYTASQALKLGLIDEIDQFENFKSVITEEGTPLEGCKFVSYRFMKQRSFMESMMGMASKMKGADTDTLEGIPSAVWNEMNLKGPLYLYQK